MPPKKEKRKKKRAAEKEDGTTNDIVDEDKLVPDTANAWEVKPFEEGEMSAPLLEESSFATLFPKYREKYLQQIWPQVTALLKQQGIGCELNLVDGTLTVKTTRKTWDPWAIMKARDFIKLLARSVPFPQAAKIILEEDMSCDIVNIGGFVRNKARFVNRRQRLLGPKGDTLKGTTVAMMGPFKGLKTARMVVEDCMQNVHPIYHIKTLMIKRELAADPEMKNESWDRFLPKFKSRNVKRKKRPADDVSKRKEKKPYTPFPPEPTPRKVDLQIESGEYFLSASTKKKRAEEEKEQRVRDKREERNERRRQPYIAPEENPIELGKRKRSSTVEQRSASEIAKDIMKRSGDGTKKRRRLTE